MFRLLAFIAALLSVNVCALSAAAENKNYWVQVTSQRSESEALIAYQNLKNKFPSVLYNRRPIIDRVQTDTSNVFFRVMTGPFTTAVEASNFCSSLRAAGGQCIVQLAVLAPTVIAPESKPTRLENAIVSVPMKKDGGTYGVSVLMNGTISLNFIVDSGAADVSVPADVFLTLMRTGTIMDSDITGKQMYILADGSKSELPTFTIRSLKVGNYVVTNVRGSVASVQGSLLLGQSFLERFKSWSIKNATHELLLEPQ